eukprot:6196474-Pleurochrysis_carterae.AAC.1
MVLSSVLESFVKCACKRGHEANSNTNPAQSKIYRRKNPSHIAADIPAPGYRYGLLDLARHGAIHVLHTCAEILQRTSNHHYS